METEVRRLRIDSGNKVIVFQFLDDRHNANLVRNIRTDTLEFHANFECIWTLGSACRILKDKSQYGETNKNKKETFRTELKTALKSRKMSLRSHGTGSKLCENVTRAI